jgi:anti-anti-sigma regulatory factor
MSMITIWLNVDGKSPAAVLHEATERLSEAEGEIILDFMSMCRIDSAALQAIERLASKAAERAVKIVLRDVNVDVYKVLKLTKLAPRFSFVNGDGNHGTKKAESHHAKSSTK